MKNFYQLLQKIKYCPVVYLGKPSITYLHSLLIGYLSTRYEMGLDREGTILEGFQEWIQARDKTNLSISWAQIILGRSSSERSAFSEFLELLEQFLKQKDSLDNSNESEDNSHLLSQQSVLKSRSLYKLLEGIKSRPGMYLGTSSITKLDMTLRGYDLARREVGILPGEEEKEFAGFESWIQEKYEIKSGQSWAKIILFYSVDEPEALTRFFELFEEYLNRNQRGLPGEKLITKSIGR